MTEQEQVLHGNGASIGVTLAKGWLVLAAVRRGSGKVGDGSRRGMAGVSAGEASEGMKGYFWNAQIMGPNNDRRPNL